MANNDISPREMIAELRERGLTTAEIAGDLDRDPSIVRQILSGKKSGEHYRQTLTELYTTGRARTIPPRRRTKSGQISKVRAKSGGEDKSVTPVEHQARYREQPKRGTYRPGETMYFRGGGRQYEVDFPKTKRAKGRAQGWDRVKKQARSAARKQWGERQLPEKRVKFNITFSDGRVMEVGGKGGYSAEDFNQGIKDNDGDVEAFLMSQAQGPGGKARYKGLDVSKTPITGVSTTVYPWK
ncbi:hypothetical protein [Arthrobacter pigmenti]